MRSMSALLMLLATAPAAAAPKAGLTVEDMLAMQRVSDPVPSPDGSRIAFTLRDTDYDANRGRTDVWVAAADGSSVTRLTTHPDNDSDPQWSPDGRWIYFLSSRSGSSQVWRIALAGGEAEPVTKLPLDVDGYKLFPDGRRLALALDVYPDAKTLADTGKRDEELAKRKSKARAYDGLLYRHWDHWEDGKFEHLFAWTSDKELKDLTPGQMTDSPTHPFGGMEQVTISPDGKWLAFEARVGGREVAWTTNTDIFLVPTDGGAKPTNLTAENKAYDEDPQFSPDGRSILYAAMARPGFEADRRRLVVIDVASRKHRVLTDAWDRSPGGFSWSRDGKTIFAAAENVGNQSLYAIDAATGIAKVVVDKGNNDAPRAVGDRIVFTKDTLTMPAEVFTARADGSDVRQVTHFNDARVANIAWGKYEQFSFKGAKGETVYGFVVEPANMKPGQKVPVAFLIHGGPQGSFGDHFHYRWNPEVFAGHGYAAVMIDFHGSTGYGQAFTDAISGDWGGAPFDDLMAGLDAAIAKYSYLDGSRVAALGASYGGYMINWLQGKTDRFRALVCHDGIFDTRFAYYDTEEVWFPEWEHHGTPWEKPEEYAKSNPIELVKNWKTPELVIHGGLDYRIPETHAMGAFTALQRKGVPSRFLELPDENHWVLKPQNSKRWHDEVFAWIDKYTKRAK
jgi:dipeptidyl aminopeptidase/acylaminoacyl peptidase